MGSPTGHFQSLYLSPIPGEHYRGAVITNDVPLYHTAYTRVLVFTHEWGVEMPVKISRTQR